MTKAAALHLDFETRSTVDLRKAGMYRYAEDPTTEVICLSWRLGDGPVQRWHPGQPIPKELGAHQGVYVAHNAGFERTIWNHKLCIGDEYGHFACIALEPEWQDCTMARAQAVSLPASLFGVGEALKLSSVKDMGGHTLMMQMCRPRKVIGRESELIWWDEPELIAQLQAYCDQDVISECEVDKALPYLSDAERRVWVLDQKINDRGVMIDVPMVERALAVTLEAKGRADKLMKKLTDGVVSKCTEAKRIIAWLNTRGIPCDSVADGETESLLMLADLMSDTAAAEVIKLRQATVTASKFQAMLDTVCRDGRVRGSLQYHAAISGRWAGRGMQPQNFKRIETEEDEETVATVLEALPQDNALDIIELWEGEGQALEALSLCARPMLIAAPGKKFVGGDLTNIEGRLNAWFAGEEWKLRAFRDYDAGVGPDLYKVMAGRIVDKEPDAVSKEDRQVWGKVPELACGYQGGLGAFNKMGAKYGVRLADDQVMRIVRGWRAENPGIVTSWAALQEAALQAVQHPGMITSCLNSKVRYIVDGDFLFCKVPSGGVISYPSPSVEWKTKEVTIDGEVVEISRMGVSYWAEKNKRMMKHDLYGGAQCAHVVSRTARDILAYHAMPRAEEEGFKIVLTVHDELLTEVAEDSLIHAPEVLQDIMVEPLAWAKDLPLAAKCWEGPRYVK